MRHDNVANVDVGAAELNHQADAEEHQRQRVVDGNPLEATSLSNGPSEGDGGEAHAGAVNVGDVRGFGHGGVPGDHAHGREEVAPDHGAGKDEGEHDAGQENVGVAEEVGRDKVDGGEPLLIGNKAGHEETAKDKKADYER